MFEKKTKIVCTIGPSSWDPEIMKGMVENGMNCARVNGAFADPNELDKVRKLVKDVSSEVSLMVDVKGPEVRMNKFSKPKSIREGDIITIGNSEKDEIYPANYKDLYTFLKPGQRIVVGDGDVELILREKKGDQMICEVTYGELLKPGKALNLPGAEYSSEVLTEKDIINLKHAIKTGWDFVSASFIQNAEAAKTVSKFLEGSRMKLIAKIEDQEGIDNIEEILEHVEGIMIARGGLGIELGLENVPLAQQYLTMKANEAGKPVITATQMMESMINNPRPTRAEVNDVATAIMLGSDAVMLSAESSAGKHPVETVKALSNIAIAIENGLVPDIIQEQAHGSITTDAISKAAAQMCINGNIDKVIVVSRTGRTARLIGRHGITQPMYVFTKDDYYARRMMLSKGINRTFVHAGGASDRDEAVNTIIKKCLDLGIIKHGENILFIAKSPLKEKYFPNVFEVISV
ncbi:MAG: pyruvate kinase [Candidatus Dojkabacteria bacterium]